MLLTFECCYFFRVALLSRSNRIQDNQATSIVKKVAPTQNTKRDAKPTVQSGMAKEEIVVCPVLFY